MSVVAGLLILNLLIILHELGHLAAARAAGLAVPEFAVGFGPRLLGIRRGGTDFVLRLLPLGGYVILPDLGGEAGEDARPAPGVSRRLWAVLAGPLANLLLVAVLLGPAMTLRLVGVFYGALGALIIGQGAAGAELIGIVGIVRETARAVDMGWDALRWTIAALSLSLGLVNLLPLPGLDGGRLVTLGIEWVRGGRRPAWEPAVHAAGLILLLVLGLWLAGREIWALLV